MRSKIFAAAVGLAFLFSSSASLAESMSVTSIITSKGEIVGTSNASGVTVNIISTPGQILGSTVETFLGRGDYGVKGTAVGSDDGHLTIDAPITWSSATTLTLFADGDITINASITGLNGTVTLNAGGDICIVGDAIVEVGELISSGRIPAHRSAPQFRWVFDEDSCW